MEEAEEVARAAREETDERVDEEAADLPITCSYCCTAVAVSCRTRSGCSMRRRR